MNEGKSKAVSASRKTGAGASTTQSTVSVVTPEQRANMIAEAAYYRAERRGFQDGGSQQDWLEAEAEIDRMLGGMVH